MEKITPRTQNYSQWYQDIVEHAGLAEHSDVRGCMVIKPYGYAIWEGMQQQLDRMFKETGHQNAYFPLFIPKSFLSKEAAHVEGFAKECAIVTHYRLRNAPDGRGVEVDPEARLEEELVVRPTSETIIWNTFRNWIKSWRDLPLLINQWANVVRWEMRTRLFLRTAEFLWQEGHTAHATREEAIEEAERMLEVYARFAEDWMAMPVIKGLKTPSERFAGAEETYCIEALMQDGKALQAGTSHFLGQNFAKAFDVKFAAPDGTLQYVWATSWGVSTRLMGALILTHSDDNGLVLPPRLAPVQVVAIPIYRSEEERQTTCAQVERIVQNLRAAGIRAQTDTRDTHKPGWKFSEHEVRGVPLRVAVGPRDIQNGTAELARRDTLTKTLVPVDTLITHIPQILDEIQDHLLQRARQRLQDGITRVDSWAEFCDVLEKKGGFLSAHWDGTAETEARIKELTKATIRCIPLNNPPEEGTCVLTGRPSKQRVLFARAY
ncbi:MAG: proline--tRNA ligase [Flavobacteriales bacterium]|nr:proline--tRNA ligase [Flavobacteriales bacterium]MCX7767982.1 proline--tRNA ligase [Flavobacteriales bacterium]MDW8409187.1 proline--tRNA ligase [Flavobacteriales bacterium]